MGFCLRSNGVLLDYQEHEQINQEFDEFNENIVFVGIYLYKVELKFELRGHVLGCGKIAERKLLSCVSLFFFFFFFFGK